ncbi:AAA family ATPase, partial [bacterium]|nr:AAA family ATPase [bacterium]
EKYEIMNDSAPEVSVMHNYLDWVLHLPWDKSSCENINFTKIYEELNKSHYGLEEIKARITEYIAIKNINKDIKSPVICLVGPPGTGKTSIAMSISNALNRKFYKISVGGLNDSMELIGTRRTYLASMPGKIIQGINKCGVNNPVILIDEVDKMIRDYKGDPASTLLEILDPVQNKYFMDNYIEEPFDLSNILFILTANNIEQIPAPLLDRVEVIEINSYTIFEKIDIAKNYLLPKILKENMVFEEKIKFSDDLIYFIINKYTKEAGLRDLERVLSSLARKITINNVKQLSERKVIKLLGEPKYRDEDVFLNAPGQVNILAYTPLGGILSKIETVIYKGTEKINITGNVGKVMNESVNVALSMIKNKYKYNFHNYDLHIHFLTAGIKKDGPSAGLSIAVAITSLMENKTVSENIAFTGEITLQGNILKIGGLKEKLIGAFNKNISCCYIPLENKDDLKDMPKEILKKIDIKLVSNFDEVYKDLFK